MVHSSFRYLATTESEPDVKFMNHTPEDIAARKKAKSGCVKSTGKGTTDNPRSKKQKTATAVYNDAFEFKTLFYIRKLKAAAPSWCGRGDGRAAANKLDLANHKVQINNTYFNKFPNEFPGKCVVKMKTDYYIVLVDLAVSSWASHLV